jgi:cell wall assembly regulator SMI1
MRQLHWFEAGQALTPGELAKAQARLGVTLPDDYISLVSRHDGGSNPDECEFAYLDQGSTRIGNFGVLLSLRPGDSETVHGTLEDLGDQLPKNVIPIVGSGSGDFICLDYRAGSPSVVYFAHERVGDEAMIPLASSVAELVDHLQKPSDD